MNGLQVASFLKVSATIVSLVATLFCFGQEAKWYNLALRSQNDKVGFSAIASLSELSIQAAFFGISVKMKSEESFEIQYRYNDGTSWSSWNPFYLNHEGATQDYFTYSADLISGKAAVVEVKSSEGVEILLRVVALKESVNTGSGELQQMEGCNCETPQVCKRDCWCPSGDCPYDTTPESTHPSHVILHHSAGNNQSADYGAVVRYYYDFHTQTNGWDDIGYNWLIDPNGVVYEGRPSGLQGAHFSCMNQETVGICLIGDFTNVAPSAAAINSLQKLLAAEMCVYDLNPVGFSWHPSSQLQLPVIATHRDGNMSNSPNSCASGTVCPGTQFYAETDGIRETVGQFPCLQTGVTQFEAVATLPLSIVRQGEYQAIYNQLNLPAEVQVVSTTGKVVFEGVILPQSLVELPTLPKGVYVARNVSGDAVVKFLVE